MFGKERGAVLQDAPVNRQHWLPRKPLPAAWAGMDSGQRLPRPHTSACINNCPVWSHSGPWKTAHCSWQTWKSVFIPSAPDTLCRAESSSGEPGMCLESAQELGSPAGPWGLRSALLGQQDLWRHNSLRVGKWKIRMDKQQQERDEAGGRSGGNIKMAG